MADPVVHWEIGGRDLDALSAFYRRVFGWEPTSFDPDYRLVNLEEGIGGGLMRCRDGMPSYVTIYVAVADLDVTLAKAEEAGGKPLLPPPPLPRVGGVAQLQDPQGNNKGFNRAVTPGGR
jgi:predicted enzyme related to lactoylglutathione lyase